MPAVDAALPALIETEVARFHRMYPFLDPARLSRVANHEESAESILDTFRPTESGNVPSNLLSDLVSPLTLYFEFILATASSTPIDPRPIHRYFQHIFEMHHQYGKSVSEIREQHLKFHTQRLAEMYTSRQVDGWGTPPSMHSFSFSSDIRHSFSSGTRNKPTLKGEPTSDKSGPSSSATSIKPTVKRDPGANKSAKAAPPSKATPRKSSTKRARSADPSDEGKKKFARAASRVRRTKAPTPPAESQEAESEDEASASEALAVRDDMDVDVTPSPVRGTRSQTQAAARARLAKETKAPKKGVKSAVKADAKGKAKAAGVPQGTKRGKPEASQVGVDEAATQLSEIKFGPPTSSTKALQSFKRPNVPYTLNAPGSPTSPPKSAAPHPPSPGFDEAGPPITTLPVEDADMEDPLDEGVLDLPGFGTAPGSRLSMKLDTLLMVEMDVFPAQADGQVEETSLQNIPSGPAPADGQAEEVQPERTPIGSARAHDQADFARSLADTLTTSAQAGATSRTTTVFSHVAPPRPKLLTNAAPSRQLAGRAGPSSTSFLDPSVEYMEKVLAASPQCLSDSPSWKELLETWRRYENVNDIHTTLPMSARPGAYNRFQTFAQPISFVEQWGPKEKTEWPAAFMDYYLMLQPAWRYSDIPDDAERVLKLLRPVPVDNDHDLSLLAKKLGHRGPKGVVLLIVGFIWWASVQDPTARDDNAFQTVVEDLTWVLTELLGRPVLDLAGPASASH